MSAAAAPPSPPGARAPAPWAPALTLAVLGAACAAALGGAAPDAPGARRLASPETLLAAFDTAAVLLLARPGRRDVFETLALAALAAPFHAALAAPLGAAAGFHAAAGVTAGAWACAALLGGRMAPRAFASIVASAAFALPLAAYGLAEFASLPSVVPFQASPLTGPVLLARRAATAGPADGAPALVAAAVAVAAAWLSGRDREERTA